MVTLKVGVHKISAQHRGNTLFVKNTYKYGGALAPKVLEAGLGIPIHERGTWLLRTDKPDLVANLFKVMDSIDLRRDADRDRVTLLIDELRLNVHEVEKVIEG